MIRSVTAFATVGLVALLLFYVSRFWNFRLWDDAGLFGLRILRPDGGLLALWLQGTPFEPFELIIWAMGSILILTGLETVLQRLSRGGN